MPRYNMPQKRLFQGFLPPKLCDRLYFPFFPRGMLTHNRENIWRLILAQEQREDRQRVTTVRGRELEGLKILAITKKKPKPKLPGFMGIQQLLLLLLPGWILPKIKPQMLFCTPLKNQDPILCPPPGNHIIPCSLWGCRRKGTAKEGVSWGRIRFSRMPVAGGKPDALNIPH